MRRALACLFSAAVGTAACGGAPTAEGHAAVTVFAAASLREAFDDLRAELAGDPAGPIVAYSFAGSQQLVAQVEAGAPADVVATADPVSMARLVGAGLVEKPREFATNRLAIAVPPGNPKGVRELADLRRADLRVVLADPSVPAGRYGRQALDRAGVAVRPVSFELDVRSAAAKVASGEADAALVYATDVPTGAQVPIPEAANVTATYPVAVVVGTGHRVAGRDFLDRLLGARGRDILLARWFDIP